MADPVIPPARALGLERAGLVPLEVRTERDGSLPGDLVRESVKREPDGSLLFKLRLASTYPVLRWGNVNGSYEEFEEVLSFEPGAHRSERIASGRCPLLAVHNTYSLDSVLGVLSDPVFGRGASGFLDATCRVSARADLEGVRKDIEARILTNVSIGYRVYQYRDVTEREPETPNQVIQVPAVRPPKKVRRLLAIDWETREGSLVPVGADPTAATRTTGAREGVSSVLWAKPEKRTMDPEEVREGQTNAVPPVAVATPAKPDAAQAAAERKAAEDAARAGEMARQTKIREKLRKAGLPVDGELARDLLEKPVDLPTATDRILDAVSAKDAATNVSSTVRVEGEEDKVCRAIDDALTYRGLRDSLRPDELQALRTRLAGNPFVHRSLIQVGEEYLRRVHGRTGLEQISKRDLAGAVLMTRREPSTRAPFAFHVTSDFASVLANIANKGLQRQFDLTKDTYSQWTVKGTLSDFKIASRVNLGDAPRLLRKLEGAEYSLGSVGEKGEPIQLLTYGRRVAISREAIINDDLGAFTRFPRAFGGSSKQLIADLVYSVLTTNAALADGFALFDATNHGNYITAAGNAFTGANAVAAISNTRELARRQKGIAPGNSETPFFMSVELVHLRVPESKETVAQQITSSIQAQQVSNVNPFQGAFASVMAEPRLGAVSQAAFYMMGDQVMGDTIEVSFLQGEEGPVIESRMSWNADGVDMKCRLDVGVAATEYRFLYKNDGAT